MNAATETFELKQGGYKFIFDGAVTVMCRDVGETRLAAEATGTKTLVKKHMDPGDTLKYRVWDGTDYHITLKDRRGEDSAAVVTVEAVRIKKETQ